MVNRVLNANFLFKMLAIVFSIDQSFYQSTGLSSNQALDYFLLVFPAVAIVAILVIVHYRLHAIKSLFLFPSLYFIRMWAKDSSLFS